MTSELTDRLAGLRPDGPDEMGRELAEGPAAVEATLAVVERLRPQLDRARDEASRLLLVGTGASLAMVLAAAPLFRAAEAARTAAGAPDETGSGAADAAVSGTPAGAAAARRERPVVVVEASSVLLAPTGEERFVRGDLVVVVSQSGTSPETLAAALRARAAGATVLAVTAAAGSPLAEAGQLVLHTPSGPEAGAATKSELAALAALAALAGVLPCDAAVAARLRASLEAVVADPAAVVPAGLALGRAAHAWAVGFGSAAGFARAATLLLHEKALLVTVPGTPSEFRHGPIEAVGPGDAVLLVETDPPDPGRAAYLALLAGELTELGVPLIAIGRAPLPAGRLTVPVPKLPLADRARGAERAGGADAALLLHTLLRIQQVSRLAAHARGTYRDGFRVLRTIVGAAGDLA